MTLFVENFDIAPSAGGRGAEHGPAPASREEGRLRFVVRCEPDLGTLKGDA